MRRLLQDPGRVGLERRPERGAVQFTTRVPGGSVRLLPGTVRADRPWTLVVRLPFPLILAAATVAGGATPLSSP